jgi:hypothetical protein
VVWGGKLLNRRSLWRALISIFKAAAATSTGIENENPSSTFCGFCCIMGSSYVFDRIEREQIFLKVSHTVWGLNSDRIF